MKKLKDLIPNNKKPLNEAVEDMEVALPAKVERFLERLIQTIKSYNLPKKKEQAVIARVIDSLQITPSQLTQTVQKLKKYDVVRKKTGNADADWMGETLDEKTDIIDNKLIVLKKVLTQLKTIVKKGGSVDVGKTIDMALKALADIEAAKNKL
jgi:hypothetical protein